MTTAIIIDNETHSASRLSALLEHHCSDSVHLDGSFTTMSDGLKAIDRIQPQLIFLSTQLQDNTGFDLLQEVTDKNFEIIFASDTDKYAMQAFKYNALDYLLKPIDADGLMKAVGRFANRKPVDTLSRKFESLLGNIEQLKQYTPPKKIVVPTISGFELLPVIDILRCQSDINYTTIFMKDNQKLVVAKTLKEFDEMLSDFNFFRIHNSHLVNLAYVNSYNRGKGGTVTMIDNTQLEVSTRRKEDFLKKLSGG